LQHVNIKIFASKTDIDLVDAIAVFHRWIQDNTRPELLIDVADYKHVPDGPGIMLIGHEADYSLDEAEGRLGLLYNRKKVVEGDSQATLAQAYQSAVAACQLLEADPAFAGKLKFDAGDCEVIINDRLIAPNNDATWQSHGPQIEAFFGGVLGQNAFKVEHLGEPRERFRASVKSAVPVAVSTLSA
jgi:hypothetical protein